MIAWAIPIYDPEPAASAQWQRVGRPLGPARSPPSTAGGIGLIRRGGRRGSDLKATG
jgi:hypothetical protein